MRKIKNYVVLVLLMFFSIIGAKAQVLTTYQNWTALPDSPTHLEVSWTTCKCNPAEADEIRLFVFNESGDSRTADFTLTISDEGQEAVTYTVTGLSMRPGESIQADCFSSASESLVFPVPTGFNPSTLTISITYN